jgi:two-component system phosphate regulon sensor histidine kinase PhoR
MKSSGMRWIIPAVIIAITALIVFQINWLVREAEMKKEDEKRRVGEAVRATCIAMEDQLAHGFIGNQLDSVFVRQPFPSNDTFTTHELIIIDDTDIAVRRPPVPPLPPMPPIPHGHPGHPDVPVIVHKDSNQVIMMRTERMKAAVQDVMMEYVFRAGVPGSIDTVKLDSTLSVKLNEHGINYQYTREIQPARRQFIRNNDSAASEWEFRSKIYAGDPGPFGPELVVSIDPGSSSVFMRILPQIIFSFLITAGMLILFLMIYREALKQKKIGEIRRDFINNMTHEFKTPLATMSLAADTIMNEKIIGDREKVKYYAEQIKSENKKLNQQVEKVLELALTEKTGVHMHKERLNLTEVVLRAMKSMEMQVEAKGGTLVLETNPQVILIDADSFHLERVFVNLLDNALKYGGTPPKISVTIEPYRSGTEIKITDNGKGIASSDWNLIFEPFHRVSTGDVHNVKGFGLGLSYAQSVMKEHNGSVSVTKSSNAGTTFTVIIMHV